VTENARSKWFESQAAESFESIFPAYSGLKGPAYWHKQRFRKKFYQHGNLFP